MAHAPSRDYRTWVKSGVGIAVALFVIGELGQVLAPHLQSTVPDWETTLFVAISVVGILVGVLSVFVFGIAMPLME